MGSQLRRNMSVQQDGASTDTPAPEFEQPAPVQAVPVGALVVGSAADPAEAAADRMADSALGRLQRLIAGSGDEPAHQHGPGCSHVARSTAPPSTAAAVGFEGGALDSATSERIASRRGAGATLPDDVRRRMESGFGRSFGGVRVHTDAVAADLNASVSAHAFTTGKDIFFGRGAYAPDTPEGERVLAHELAHTTQDGGVHRLFGLGKTLTPEEQQKKDEEKAAKKKAKQDAERELKEKKKVASAAEKLEKSEKVDLSKQRKEGDAERAKIAERVGQESTHADSGGTLKALHGQFAARLVMESELAADLVKNGATEEEAYEQAYRQTWRDNCPAELVALRPPRETAAERLASAVREARLEASLEDQQVERGKLGTMLSKKVEEVYEAWELETLRLRKEFPKMDAREADYQAGRTVWSQATEEIRKKRPTDPVLERKARTEAHLRLTVGKRLPPPEKDAVGDALDTTSTIAGYTKTGLTATTTIPEKILGKIGKDKDKALRGPSDSPSETLGEKLTGSFGTANYQLRTGQRSLSTPNPISNEAKASEGMGIVTGIINDLFSSVTGVMKIVKSVGEMREEGVNARRALTLTKACSDGASTGVSLAKDAANLAKLINDNVAAGVNSVVPGLSIATSALSMISNATVVADTGMRVSDNRERLLEARSRTPGAKKVDVMVWPLLHVESTLAKTLEKNIWATVLSVSNFAASIAEVASAGGYGIPAAYKAATALLDQLHSVGHMIADQVIAKLGKDAREDAVTRLEGTAETQLQRDPAMVVDGIIVRARKNKDAVAIKFLESYGIDVQTKHKDTGMGEIRTTVLGALGEDADPKYIWESYYEKFKGFIDKVKGVGTKWAETGELAQDRNKLEGAQSKNRGVGWRLKMLLFQKEAKFTRSKNKTLAQKESQGDIEVRIGKVVLLKNASKSEEEQFLTDFEQLPDQALRDAINDKATSEEWRVALIQIMGDRLLEKQGKGSP
ncbi:MAG: DUF4157 domain-containing protein [Jatrophihabitans sp.]|nr:MAG: DUF4157 domain-containing protein [Jatrophihabitans sp.]